MRKTKNKGNSSSLSEKDRISRLPESLIQHILSFLYTKDAVQTCILSKRWRYVWTSLPVLRFNDSFHFCESNDEDTDREDSDATHDDEDRYATKRFIKFVDNVLSLRDNNSNIQSFYIECSRYYMANEYDEVGGCINRCIATAVSHNVQELYIQANTDADFEIPLCLGTCESLTKLELFLFGNTDDYDSKIILSHEMSLPRLKSLHLDLEYLSFNDEELTNQFFSSFPTLESLVILFRGSSSECGFRNMNLNISLPKLKYLEFEGRRYEINSGITLYAPSLSSFRFGIIFCAQRTLGILRGIRSVKVLTLNDSILENLSGAFDTLDTHLLELCNLQHLELNTYLSRDCMRSIFYILKNSPNIESVAVQILQHSEMVFIEHSIGDHWDIGLSLPSMIRHLKIVEIKGLHGCVNELKFLEILLKHATVLEKVVLYSYSTKQESQKVKRMNKFSEMLLKFPTASKKILILFKF